MIRKPRLNVEINKDLGSFINIFYGNYKMVLNYNCILYAVYQIYPAQIIMYNAHIRPIEIHVQGAKNCNSYPDAIFK